MPNDLTDAFDRMPHEERVRRFRELSAKHQAEVEHEYWLSKLRALHPGKSDHDCWLELLGYDTASKITPSASETSPRDPKTATSGS